MGTVTYADGMIYLQLPDGIIRLIKANPEKYEPVCEFKLPAGSSEAWAHLSIADGRLYTRRGPALMVFDIAAHPVNTGKPVGRTQLAFPRWDTAGIATVKLARWANGVATPTCPAPPTIDGKLDDPCWKTAPPVDFQAPDNINPLSAPVVEFRLCQDKDNLYLAYRREEGTRSGKPAPLAARGIKEDARFYGDDAIEIFLSDAKRDNGVHLGLSAGGGWFCGRRQILSLDDSNFKWADRAHWQRAIQKTDTTWTAEIAIPRGMLAKAGLDPATLAINLLSQNTSGQGPSQRLLCQPGSTGFEWCKEFLPLVDSPRQFASPRFTARLLLPKPLDGKPVPAPFDLSLQGTRMLKGFDLVKSLGAQSEPLAQEFKKLKPAADGTLTLQVDPPASSAGIGAMQILFGDGQK